MRSLLAALTLVTLLAVPAVAGVDRLDITWTAGPGTPPEGYILERAPAAGGPFAEIARPVIGAYADIGLGNGVTRCYRVAAFLNGSPPIVSPYSAVVCGTTTAAPPTAPQGLSVR